MVNLNENISHCENSINYFKNSEYSPLSNQWWFRMATFLAEIFLLLCLKEVFLLEGVYTGIPPLVRLDLLNSDEVQYGSENDHRMKKYYGRTSDEYGIVKRSLAGYGHRKKRGNIREFGPLDIQLISKPKRAFMHEIKREDAYEQPFIILDLNGGRTPQKRKIHLHKRLSGIRHGFERQFDWCIGMHCFLHCNHLLCCLLISSVIRALSPCTPFLLFNSQHRRATIWKVFRKFPQTSNENFRLKKTSVKFWQKTFLKISKFIDLSGFEGGFPSRIQSLDTAKPCAARNPGRMVNTPGP